MTYEKIIFNRTPNFDVAKLLGDYKLTMPGSTSQADEYDAFRIFGISIVAASLHQTPLDVTCIDDRGHRTDITMSPLIEGNRDIPVMDVTVEGDNQKFLQESLDMIRQLPRELGSFIITHKIIGQ